MPAKMEHPYQVYVPLLFLLCMLCFGAAEHQRAHDSGCDVCSWPTLLQLLSVPHPTCWREQGSHFSTTQPIQTTQPHSTLNLASYQKSVDFVFLLEFPDAFNQTNLQYMIKGVTNLVETLQDERGYGDVQARYAIVAYSLHASDCVFIQDFIPVQVESRVGELLTSLSSEQSKERKQRDPKLLRYLAVDKSLQMVSALVKEKSLILTSGVVTRLHRRRSADFQIVSILDLHESVSPQPLTEHTKGMIRSTKRSIDLEVSDLVETMKKTKKISLHFFFDSSNKAAATYLGNPFYSVRYADCSHFNKALTLKGLIRAGRVQGSSLQAHLLARGMDIQVQNLTDLNQHNCILGINPALWSQFGPHEVTFMDKCTKASCARGLYCSSLHGCIKKESNRSKADTFEGKVPLSVDFSASHADLAASGKQQNVEANVTLRSEQLSITAMPEGPVVPFDLSDIVMGQPPILEWRPEKPFVEEMIRKGEPVVLKNTVIQTWPIMTKLNLSYLAENIGYETLEAVKCTNTFVTFDPDRRAPLKLNISVPFITTNMTTGVFFDCIQDPENCFDGYKGHYYFGSVPEALRADVVPDRLLYNTDKDYEAKKQFMWISSAGMITHGHFDQDFNFFVQLFGKKRFTLWSPSQHELMYVFPRIHPMWHKSRVNFRALDLSRFPQFAKTRALQIKLGPGDVLFVPPYTWHYVETLTPSVSLSTWSHDHNLYDHMNAIYRHDHKFDLLAETRGRLLKLNLFNSQLHPKMLIRTQRLALQIDLAWLQFSGLLVS